MTGIANVSRWQQLTEGTTDVSLEQKPTATGADQHDSRQDSLPWHPPSEAKANHPNCEWN
jgi:hypothetical protein